MSKRRTPRKRDEQQPLTNGSEMTMDSKQMLKNALQKISPTRAERRKNGIFQRSQRIRTGQPEAWNGLGKGRLVKETELKTLTKAELSQVMTANKLPFNTKTTKDAMITAILKARVKVIE